MLLRAWHGLGVCVLVFGFTACSSGGAHHTAPPTGNPIVVAPATGPVAALVTTSTTAPLPSAVRELAGPSPCPATLPAAPRSSGVARPDMSLVPIAAISMDVCNYVGSATAKTLQGDVVFNGLDADTLENAANGVEGIDPVSGPRCEPSADASVLVIVSDGGHVEQLLASIAGCRGLSNGYLSAAATPTWRADLEHAVALGDQCTRELGSSARCLASR